MYTRTDRKIEINTPVETVGALGVVGVVGGVVVGGFSNIRQIIPWM